MDNVRLIYKLYFLVKITILSKAQFYASQLEESMAGYGTDDHQLIRIIVGRSEIDLNEIKEAYEHMYGAKLIDRVSVSRTLIFSFINYYKINPNIVSACKNIRFQTLIR